METIASGGWNGQNGVMEIGYVLLTAWGALTFGAVYSWGYIPLLLGSVALGLLGLLSFSLKKNASITPMAIGVAAFGIGVLLQLIPLPRTALIRYSPSTDLLLHRSDLLYTLSNATHPLSIYPDQTWMGLVSFTALALLLLGSLRGFSRLSRRTFVRGLLMVGAIVALVGILQRATGVQRAYGFWAWPIDLAPFGPFGNKNHFAGWMLMALPLGLGYFLGLVERGMRSTDDHDWRKRVLWLGSSDASEILLTGASVTLMALALVLTLSRSGIGAFMVALMITAGCLSRVRSARNYRVVGVGCLGCLGLVSIRWTGTDAVLNHFAALSGSGLDGRVGVWGDTIRIIKDFFVAGIGLNTYGRAMLVYQTANLPNLYVWAHNDYLQLAAEGGLLVGIPALILIGIFTREVRHRFQEQTDDCVGYWIRIGAVTAILAVAVQEMVDFSLQIPGNAVLFTFLCALAAAKGKSQIASPS